MDTKQSKEGYSICYSESVPKEMKKIAKAMRKQ